MKQGANKTDQVKIKNLYADGKSAGYIGKSLGICPKVVANFDPEVIKAAKAKAKAAETK